MHEGDFSTVYVAPLKIRKDSKLATDYFGSGECEDVNEVVEETIIPRQKFQNFLRASYTFQPPEQPAASTVTLPLSQGDIVLVHSIHTNGWADGTHLESGARGWLPTNYCEPYDYATMRPLLKALTEFWDIIRSSTESNMRLYHNHDYMRGMVAGVRFLLEKADCLTRDSELVKKHDNVRRTRKCLLADLSTLVKASKTVQGLSASMSAATDFDSLLDEMLLKAFQVVTRAVLFFDIWSEEIAFAQTSSMALAGTSFSLEPQSPTAVRSPRDSTTFNVSKRTSFHSARQSTLQRTHDEQGHQCKPRPASMTRPPVLTHRMSYTSRGTTSVKSNLASEQLSDTYDAFLGVLASFLGSHMQSRSSSELLLTTQQAVKSCRKLLEIVEIIHEHDFSEGLQQAKDAMYDKIADLIHATREVFRPLQSEDEDMIYLPDQGQQLVNAATACVSGAGRCVAKARVLLEDIGDFELELKSDTSSVTTPFDARSFQSPARSRMTSIHSDTSIDPLESRRPSKPRLEIPSGLNLTCASSTTLAPTPSSGSFWTPLTDITSTTESSDASMSPKTGSPTERPPPEPTAPAPEIPTLGRAATHGSESTLVSSIRDSGPSFVSQTSTRATSPDLHLKGSPKQIVEEGEEGEEALLENQFAHELMFNQEGRIIGGTINAIIERLTSHENTPELDFSTMVFLTFRLWTTPSEMIEALQYRFDYVGQTPRIAGPVRLRIANVLKQWLESHWRHDCDESLLPTITGFTREKILPVSATAANRLFELIEVVASNRSPPIPRTVSSIGKTSLAGPSNLEREGSFPAPALSKSQLNALRVWKLSGTGVSILDFDPLELARQLTLKTSQIFCAILPEELLGGEFQKQTSSLAVNVRASAQLSTDLTTFVTSSILQLEEAKKRASTIKQWIKVANKCLELRNYDTLMAIVCSINSSTILRLKRTWDLIGQKAKGTFSELKKVVDVSKNYSALRQRIEAHAPPCIPFVGMILTDLTFVDHGNPALRELKQGENVTTVINLDKHTKTAKIISDLQKFQVAYKLHSVDELQTWLQAEFVRVRAAGERDFHNQYRRSLVLEPRDGAAIQRQNKLSAFTTMSTLTGKDKFDFLAWTHLKENKENRERNGSISSQV